MQAEGIQEQVGGVVDALDRLWDQGRKDDALDIVREVLEATLRANHLQEQKIAELVRRVYGKSSERIDPNQLKLALQELREAEAEAAKVEPAPDTEVPSDPPTPERSRRQGKRRARRQWPKDIEREEIRLVPTAEQIAGPGKWSKVGETQSEVLEYVPAKFKLLVYVRETWSSDQGAIVTAPVPSKVIEKGLAGPGLLTEVALSKFEDQMPLNRQVKVFGRSGIDLHRNTLVDWVAMVAFLLQPLANRIHELAMLAHALQVDDTHLNTLDRQKAKNIKKAHLWVMVGDLKYIAFRYTPDWTAARAKEFLGKRIGWMQVDGYAGFESIAKGGLILLVGCWMHARRYFHKAFEGKDMRAAVPLKMIGRLYDIERESKEAGDNHDQRYERRQRDMVPVMNELGEWLDEHEKAFEPSSLLAKAVTYARNHWEILQVVVKDGALELDNGDVERVIRSPAMGRRNWLFAGSDAGGERAAVILTVLQTAKRAGVDLREYVHDVLVKISGGWPQSRLDELLPEQWLAARQAEKP